MREVAPNLLRLEARYDTLHQLGVMVFHFRDFNSPHPTDWDCRELAHLYGVWENDGTGAGYASFRSHDSGFTAANVWSIDPQSKASFIDVPFNRPGIVSDFDFAVLPTALAPRVEWPCPGRRRRVSHTFAVGLTIGANAEGLDSNHVGVDYANALVTQFDLLRTNCLAAGYEMRALQTRKVLQGGVLVNPSFPVLQCVMSSRRMSTQVRRVRDPLPGGVL